MYKQVRALQEKENQKRANSHINGKFYEESLENEYLQLLQSQKGDLFTTTRSSLRSAITRTMSRMASRISKAPKESTLGNSKSSSESGTKNFLEVPKQNFGIAKRLDFILRKRTRLIERQKTKVPEMFTFGNEKEDPMP